MVSIAESIADCNHCVNSLDAQKMIGRDKLIKIIDKIKKQVEVTN